MRAEISIVDRLSGTVIDTLRVPSPYSGSALAMVSQVGHFLPLGSRGALHGVSLLQHDLQKPLWTTSPKPIALDLDQTLVRSERTDVLLLSIALATCSWSTPAPESCCGSGPISIRSRAWSAIRYGASSATTTCSSCWDADHLAYTVYRTATGEELRQGRTRQRVAADRPSGARSDAACSYFTPTRRTTACEFGIRSAIDCCTTRATSEQPLWKDTGEDEVAVILADGTLQIVDGRTGAVRVSASLSPREIQRACATGRVPRCGSLLRELAAAAVTAAAAACYNPTASAPTRCCRGSICAATCSRSIVTAGQLLWKRTFRSGRCCELLRCVCPCW